MAQRPLSKSILITLLIILGLLISSCSSSKTVSTSNPPSTTSTIPASGLDKYSTLWLCNPHEVTNPCLGDLTTTSISADSKKTIVHIKKAVNPPIDCFYLYPTVSNQSTGNESLTIGPSEIGVAEAQAEMFSQVCNVYAPIYRQTTLKGLLGTANPPPNGQIAYSSALSGFEDYLNHYNDNRGFVILGHSQGSFLMTGIIKNVIDNNASLRKRLLSAILLGGNVTVKDGSESGGSFNNIPVCITESELHCVIAYSSYNTLPPSTAIFGRTGLVGQHVVCVNPAQLSSNSNSLIPYIPTKLNFSLIGNSGYDIPATTPFATYPGLLSGTCSNAGGANFLDVTENLIPNDQRPVLKETLGPMWGLHLYDMNIAQGNLVEIVRVESQSYLSK